MTDQNAITAETVNAQAEQIEQQHAGDTWRISAAQHLRAAADRLGAAEREDERKQQEAEQQAEREKEPSDG